jgi:prefoldin subunit 5
MENIKKRLEQETTEYQTLGRELNALAQQSQQIQQKMHALDVQMVRKQGAIEALTELLGSTEPPEDPSKPPETP